MKEEEEKKKIEEFVWKITRLQHRLDASHAFHNEEDPKKSQHYLYNHAAYILQELPGEKKIAGFANVYMIDESIGAVQILFLGFPTEIAEKQMSLFQPTIPLYHTSTIDIRNIEPNGIIFPIQIQRYDLENNLPGNLTKLSDPEILTKISEGPYGEGLNPTLKYAPHSLEARIFNVSKDDVDALHKTIGQ